LPRYLNAMRLRAERLAMDPRKDQARMLGVRDLEAQWRAALGRLGSPAAAADPQPLAGAAAGDPRRAAVEAIRWSIEELRVQVFAQELRTREVVSEKRIQRALEALAHD